MLSLGMTKTHSSLFIIIIIIIIIIQELTQNVKYSFSEVSIISVCSLLSSLHQYK
jgi:hypothetical protein